MMKCIFVLAPFVVASEDVMHDEGVSLLQMRAQPHKNAQDPKYYTGAGGTDCPPGEDLTFAQCLEAEVKNIIPHVQGLWNIMYNQRSTGMMQTGCFTVSNKIYFSDQPKGTPTPNAAFKPICAANGGFDAEAAHMTCEPENCYNTQHVIWKDSLVMPELEILEAGAVCEACGILTYAQCSKAGDMGLIEAIYGSKMTQEPRTRCVNAGTLSSAMPSGCTVGSPTQGTDWSFCPYDTPDGALAGLVSDSGVGVGSSLWRPVCGKCTTTTTPPPADDMDDEAGAVADPHMSTNSGKGFDLTDGH